MLILAASGLTLGRVVLMWSQAPENWQVSGADVLQAFWLGARFDLKVLALLLGAPVLLLGLGVRFVPVQRIARPLTLLWQGLWPVWCVLVLLCINLLMVVNHYYFQFYQSPINDLVFGLAQDDTWAVLLTIWHDFPVISGFAVVSALSAGQFVLACRWAHRPVFGRKSATPLKGGCIAAIVLCSLLLTAGLIRGSLGKFPLRNMHMAASNDTFVNHLVPNGVWALRQAWQTRQRYDLGNHADSGLKYYGFASPQAAILAAGFDGQTDSVFTFDWRWQSLPSWPQHRLAPPRPHVVLAVMESWGRQMMDFDDARSNDLLGRLRPWLREGRLDYFDRALSSHLGTHPSLEALLLDTPLTPLTQTRYGRTAYDTASARFYQRAGYRTVYLTAGPEAWRDLNVVLLQQGFDEVLGENAIRKRFAQASSHTWGVDDEWMFRYAQELLLEADARQQPLLLVMMSVTNHPPYRVPAGYTPAPLDVRRLGAALATDPATGMAIMQTYQYANDALGGFLDGLSSSGLLERTLIAATGDHNQRTVFAYPDNSQLHYKYGVPIVMRIPEAYRLYGSAHTQQWTSHQDIFPTLWAHSLWGHDVPRNGRNLYADNGQTGVALSFINGGIVLGDEGAAVNLASPVFYQWRRTDAAASALVPVASPDKTLSALWQRERARLALRDWRIRSQALTGQN